jgi:DNA-binding CsgD family transcriptional regulator
MTHRASTASDERAFAEVKRLAAAGIDGPPLLRRVAQALRRAVPFDAYCASTVDPASNLMTHGIAEGMSAAEGSELGRVFLDRIYFEEGLDRIAWMLRHKRPAESLFDLTGGNLERSLRYRELLRPLGLAHEVSGAFVDGSLWGGIDLSRRTGAAAFSPRELRLLRRIAPHVGTGLRVAALRARDTAQSERVRVPGILTLDSGGRVVSHTRAAERWLAELEDLHPGWLESDPPVPVRMVAGALRRALAPQSEQDLDLVPRVRVRGRSGQWLTLYASLTEPTDARPSETVVVVEPAHPQEITWLSAAAYGLSPREDEVTRLVASGCSTRQIAAALVISEYTVQRHLANIFEKVQVRSRRALLKRLFLDNLLPIHVGEARAARPH